MRDTAHGACRARYRAPTMLVDRYWEAVRAFNGRDLDGWIALMDEDVEIESRFSSFGQHRFRGHRAMGRWWDDLGEAWEYIEVEPEEVREIAPNETLTLAHLNAKGRESGVEIREPVAHHVEWRDGRWLRLNYMDREEAERRMRATPRSADPAAPS